MIEVMYYNGLITVIDYWSQDTIDTMKHSSGSPTFWILINNCLTKQNIIQ